MMIKTVVVSIGYAQPGDPGVCEIGWYSVEGAMLTMTDEDGKPMSKPHRLAPGDDPHVIASRLTRERWLKTDGGSDFNRTLRYPPLGIA